MGKNRGFDEQQLHHFLRYTVESMYQAIIATDLQGTIQICNSAAGQLLACKASDAVGKTLDASSLQASVDMPDPQAGSGVETLIIPLIHEGTVIEWQVAALKDQDTREVGTLFTARLAGRPTEGVVALPDKQEIENPYGDLPHLIWIIDGEGQSSHYNEEWIHYTGKNILEPAGWESMVHQDDAQLAQEWVLSARANNPTNATVRLRRWDGVYRWHLLRMVPAQDEQAPPSWVASATDIHELNLAATTSQQRAEWFVSVLESAIDFAVISMDKDGIINGWNSGAQRIFGYTQAEAIGQHTELIFTNEDVVGGIPALEMGLASTTGRSQDERWHQRKDGSHFFMSGVMTPIYTDGLSGYLKVTRDITERKLTEEALLLSEQRSNILLPSTQVGEWDWDIERGIIKLQQRAALILGRVPTEQELTFHAFLSMVNASDADNLRAQMEKALNGLNIFHAEFCVDEPQGDGQRWVSAYGRVVAHNGNDAVRMIGVVYDITERKIQEQQKDDFISVASHELKTPAATIKAYSELLEEVLTASASPENVSLIRKLNAQVDRLIQLIYSLLDSTSVAEGQMKLYVEPTDLNELVARQIQAFRITAPHYKLVWQPSALSILQADRERIGQVIANLLSNALKYAPAPALAIVSTEDNLDGAIVRVQDFGPGIATAHQARLFQRYYRVSGQQQEGHPGFGLGLYISAQIIRQHFGSIGVDSPPGEGATFYFKLPYT